MSLRLRQRASIARRGLTLVELVLALGLLALLVVALTQLVDSTFQIWRRAESVREDLTARSALFTQLVDDLDGLTAAEGGDLWCDWGTYDHDADGIATRQWPRLRLVRRARAEELVRLGLRESTGTAGGGRLSGGAAPLLEVLWMVVPETYPELIEARAAAEVSGSAAPGFPGDGVLLRGERLVEGGGASLLDPDFLSASGRPPAGALEEVAEGVLWLEFLFAAQTTVLRDGWNPGVELPDAARAWDARGERLDPTITAWNQGHRGHPERRPDELLFPRRLRVALEIESEESRRARAKSTAVLESDSGLLQVDRPERLPAEGTWILMGEEWLRLLSSGSREVRVERGARGSVAARHPIGTPLLFGERHVREVVVPLHREDWDL
jgi:hypothetical protein